MDALHHLALIWTGVYLAVFLAKRTKLTPVLYFLAIGALLVNVGLLPPELDPFIRGFSEVGIILIMFALGFEENPANFIHSVRRSWGIALFGAIAPFFAAYLLADYFWAQSNVSLMCGLAMTATAVSLTMVSLKSEGIQKTPAATGIMTSAVLDDIASLALVAVLVPLATGDATPDLAGISLIVAKAVAFFVLVLFIGLVVFPHDLEGWISRIPLLNRLGIIQLLSFEKGAHATLAVLLLALILGLISRQFGLHPAVGAYMAGLILREEYFLYPSESEEDQFNATKKIVDNAAFSWIGPVFFVELGTRLQFDWQIVLSVIPETVMLTVGLLIAQTSSAALAARYTGNFNWNESMMIGFGMLGRAELAFVVMDIAYVQNDILSTEAFYTLMFTAFWLNVAVPLTIMWWKPYYLGTKLWPGSRSHL